MGLNGRIIASQSADKVNDMNLVMPFALHKAIQGALISPASDEPSAPSEVRNPAWCKIVTNGGKDG